MPPCRGDLRVLFQHHVHPALLRQVVADGQPRLSAANDHDLDLLRHVFVLRWQMHRHAAIQPASLSRMSSRISL